MKFGIFTAITLAILSFSLPAFAHQRHHHRAERVINPVLESLGAGLAVMLEHAQALGRDKTGAGWASVGRQHGVASVYDEGTRTACGQRFDPNALTAAHRTLPCGAKVRVWRGTQSVVVSITDRGPFVAGRIIDLTPAAARSLGFSGLTTVELERLD